MDLVGVDGLSVPRSIGTGSSQVGLSGISTPERKRKPSVEGGEGGGVSPLGPSTTVGFSLATDCCLDKSIISGCGRCIGCATIEATLCAAGSNAPTMALPMPTARGPRAEDSSRVSWLTLVICMGGVLSLWSLVSKLTGPS